jgi:hypothetical protein
MFDSTLAARRITTMRALLLYALSATLLAACAGSVAPLTSAVADQRPAPKSQTFQYTGGSQTFQVPSHVTEIRITAEGAGTSSARGGLVKAKVGVRPGDVLTIAVGGAPHGYRGGFNGGGPGGVCGLHAPCPLRAEGGAGASDVRVGGSAPKDRILVAGGAGGNGGQGQFNGGFGGEGGGVAGRLGDNGVGVGALSETSFVGGGGGGGGATPRGGGRRGAPGKAGNANIIPGNPGAIGTLAMGGAGGSSSGDDLAGGSGGGGGGGYYGGGGGGSGANGSAKDRFGKGVGSGGGGGGGSSYVVLRATNIDIETGAGSDKNGLIVIAW